MTSDPKGRRSLGTLDFVTVSLSRGDVVLPWDSRQRLLKEIKHLDSASETIAAFEADGANLPVVLPVEGKALLVEAINMWSGNVTKDGLPDGVWALRCGARRRTSRHRRRPVER